ncbi:hypothetical protein HG531_010890 [Fusarium graminearum]|nr:hypothetical protein HG531_010890 [Fusarium graminearum]
MSDKDACSSPFAKNAVDVHHKGLLGRRVLEQDAADSKALLLATGNHESSLTDLGLVAVRERLDGVVDMGTLGDSHDFFRGILGDNTDRATQRLEVDITNILVINQDSTTLDIIGSEQETQQSRLSTSAGADNSDLLSSRNRQGQITEDRAVRVVGKVDVLKLNLAALGENQRLRTSLLLDVGVDLLEVEQSLHIQ